MPASPAAAPSPRNSEDKLYRTCLDACISGIEGLTVGPPLVSASPHSDNPARPETPDLAAASMSTGSPHSATPRGGWRGGEGSSKPASPMASGDARNYLAVQPAATNTAKSPTMSLKKVAVKVKSPAGGVKVENGKAEQKIETLVKKLDSTVKGEEKVEDPVKKLSATVKAEPKVDDPMNKLNAAVKAEQKVDDPMKKLNATELDLESRFARLNTTSAVSTPGSADAKFTFGMDKAMFNFDPKPATPTPSARAAPPKVESPVPVKNEEDKAPAEEAKDLAQANMSAEKFEQRYFELARDMLRALAATGESSPTAHHLNAAALMLRRTSSAPEYPSIIAKYFNDRSNSESVTPGMIESLLKTIDGDFLRLCGKLIEKKLLQVEDKDQVVGLCKAIIHVNTNEKNNATASTPTKSSTGVSSASKAATAKPFAKDPMENASGWPAREKRDNPALCRTCVLKGVGDFTSINRLQALVWGGRLESISLPHTGSDAATVKFLTAESCQKFFKDTENGIRVPGVQKLIIVEQGAGPNSVNDVVKACTDGDITRCVRALGADEDWSDLALLKLAKGKSKVKREVDRIKRGKTNKGTYYIEFRFSNIFHALEFKRILVSDEEWEHCNIAYAEDPCEVAKGVHIKDEDEVDV